jgi:Fe-S oxidoreductase
MDIGSLIFAILLLFAFAVFARRIYLLSAMVLLGQGENRFDHITGRVRSLLVYGFGQKRVLDKPFGFNHFLLFWGFIMLQLFVNVEFIINGVFPAFSLRFIGEAPYRFMMYAGDATSAVVLLVVAIAIVRRLFFRPWYMERKAGAYIILILVGLLMIGDLGIHVSAMAGYGEETAGLPVSGFLAAQIPAPGRGLPWSLLGSVFWWIHGLVLLVFICYIPYSKHLHILTALLNCFFRRLSFPSDLSRLVFTKGRTFGVSRVTQLTWKDLYDFLSCTECGRCAAACPATGTGKVLNPMKVILQGKANLMKSGMEVLKERRFDSLERADVHMPVRTGLIGEDGTLQVQPEAIWDCTTCGACARACPVFIEQFPKLLKARRHLVMEQGDFPPELITLFENVEQRSNPYGMSPGDRGRWAEGRSITLASSDKPFEYLLFAGCVPSFNARMANVMSSIVDCLRYGGISFAIMGKDEPCCGDPLRRTGNEYVFDRIARSNIERFKALGVRRIITFCPHCYNSFRNDYPAFGGTFEVFHHTEVISGILERNRGLPGRLKERAVIHDSCYAGRYNGIYEAPRNIVRWATGSDALEMDRARENSFCCGAGGGRLWMHESRGTRISTERTRQALATRPSVVATACPYCLIMFEDGLKDEGAAGTVKAMDVSEMAARALKGGK